ncbi:AMP-binding protein [Bradyrhizobium tropiciagri]|uniref:AMP-binding protein n=1 Tax=Bradyrhizobium tropiciagri TaxID=312253 RepID=UPI001BABEEA2|nr:AMP-binding protein [Bradyrhizobium tropiciagri]MBR0868843.1 AMP-binding protein [Bradyrhizobium tropiciagri]
MSAEFSGLGPSGHVDDFARRNLPPPHQWPKLLLDRPEFQYPDYLNAGVELTDRIVEQGMGDRIALIGNGRQRTYKELTDWSNRLAHALVENYGVKPGHRVLIRSGNNPALVAAWLAATKAGAVVVNTMPMLRAGELAKIVDKAEIALALTDSRIADELVACAKTSKFLKQVVNFDGTQNHDAELDRIALNKPVKFDAVKTGRDDVALLGFTSGTTGEPKATMHFHRDLLIVADGYAREVLKVTPDDVFVGSPPLAFTFGLGGLAIFPLRFGATATLLENAAPSEMIRIIETYKATICFTAPTAYRAMMAAMDKGADLSSLRLAVSAGETLPAPVFESWTKKTGKPILDGIGSTELLHIFITNRVGSAVGGTTGTPVGGYEAKIVDDNMNDLPAGEIGKLAVRGPTGCRYLADERQSKYVRDGWNITGDAFVCDANGRLSFVARADDMIISAGYNIAGPEVEAALLGHPDVAECAVIGAPDDERGQIVSAFVVLKPGACSDESEIKLLQDHVKATIAPYKYPRAVSFVEALPKTQTGKIQRFKLREAS